MEWDSQHYKEHAKAQIETGRVLLEKVEWNPRWRVLDLGCGEGTITRMIAKHVLQGEVIGLDPARNMIEEAKHSFGDVPNLHFVVGTAEEFHFDRPFDLITSFNALHWIKDHIPVFRSLTQALKVGGKILFVMVSFGNEQVLEVMMRPRWRAYFDRTDARYTRHNVEEYRELCNLFGFSIRRLEVAPRIHPFATREELTEAFMTWVPYQAELPREQAYEIAQEMAENVDRAQGGQRPIPLVNRMLFVEAEKR